MTVFRGDEPNDADHDRGDQIAVLIFVSLVVSLLLAILVRALWP